MGGRSAGTALKYSIKFVFIPAVGHLLVNLGLHQLDHHRRAIDAAPEDIWQLLPPEAPTA